MSRLLITGGRGFVGRSCIKQALEIGFDVHATATSPLAESVSEGLPAKWHIVDLLESRQLLDLLNKIKPTHILHTAWETTHGSYWHDLSNSAWLAMGTHLMRWSVENQLNRLVCVGSCAEYGWGDEIFREEQSSKIPHTFYGKVKLAHHEALMAIANHHGLSAVTGRIFFGYGPYENINRIIPYCCQQLLKNEIAEFSSCDFYRDFMHIDDIARGLMTLLQTDYVGSCNISSNENVLLRDIIATIGTITGKERFIRLGAKPDRTDDVKHLIGDNMVLKSLGWEPKLSLEEGLTDTYEWWSRQLLIK